jgi:Zn-dependent protease
MDIRVILIQVFVVLFAITIHEAAHAWTASKFGDHTAAAMGRVTLNPIAHIDPFGTIIFPLLLIILSGGKGPVFGWAKPVPVNPYNLRQPRRNNLWISFAGPIANILAAGAAALLFQVLKLITRGVSESSFLVKPIDGLVMILVYAAMINAALAVFNLIPIPPLDGSGILTGLLSETAAAKYERLRPYGFFLLLILMYTNILNAIFTPVQRLVLSLFR